MSLEERLRAYRQELDDAIDHELESDVHSEAIGASGRASRRVATSRASAAAGPLSGTREGFAWSRRTGVTAAAIATAAVVAVIALSVAVISGASRGSKPPATQSSAPTTTRPTPPAVPAGMRLVSFHGIEVLVPSAWRGGSVCGIPQANTVIVENGAHTQCLVDEPHGLMVVRLAAISPRLPNTIPTQPVSIDGHRARRGTGTIQVIERVPGTLRSVQFPERIAVLLVPEIGVDVSVQGPDTKAAARVLDSIHVVAVDAWGCEQHLTSLTPSTPSTRPGARDLLVPASTTKATICRYSDNWLIDSVPLPTNQMTRLVAVLNALPAGVSQPGGGNFGEVPQACAEDTRRGFVAQFTYPTGTLLLVYTHIGGCKTLYASNGSRTTKINNPLIDILTSDAGYDGGIPPFR
jgi:hypothetical protein